MGFPLGVGLGMGEVDLRSQLGSEHFSSTYVGAEFSKILHNSNRTTFGDCHKKIFLVFFLSFEI